MSTAKLPTRREPTLADRLRADLEKAEHKLAEVEALRDRFASAWSSAESEASAYRRQRDEALEVLADLLAAVDILTLADSTHHQVATAVGLPALIAHHLVERYRRVAPATSEGQDVEAV
jgi:hypothetical protein